MHHTETQDADKPRSWTDFAPGEKLTLNINGLPWTFIYCPPTGPDGFLMGSSDDEVGHIASEKPHTVVLTKPAFLMDAPVTQAQFESIVDAAPSPVPQKSKLPVASTSWKGFQKLAKKLNGMRKELNVPRGWKFSLPSEALWEYACRDFGAASGPYNAGALDDCGWYEGNSLGRVHEVRGKRPNRAGFYDIHGNLWEWVYDSWKKQPPELTVDPCYDEKNAFRVLRGGAWRNPASFCRAASRTYAADNEDEDYMGARLALVRG